MTFPSDVGIDDDLANRLSALFRELLEAERQAIVGADDARRRELHRLIEERDTVLNDEDELVRQFDEYIATLSPRPNRIRQLQMYGDWEGTLKAELAIWREELSRLNEEGDTVSPGEVYNSARSKALYLLHRAAQVADSTDADDDLQDTTQPPINFVSATNSVRDNDNWRTVYDLRAADSMTGLKPGVVLFPNGDEEIVDNWRQLHIAVANWLIDRGHLSKDNIPNRIANLISHDQEWFPSGIRKFRELKNGLFVYANYGAAETVATSCRLLEAFGKNPALLYVQLR